MPCSRVGLRRQGRKNPNQGAAAVTWLGRLPPPVAMGVWPVSLPEQVPVVPGCPTGGRACLQGLEACSSSCSATNELWVLGQIPSPFGPQFPHLNPFHRRRQAESNWLCLCQTSVISGKYISGVRALWVILMASASEIGGRNVTDPEFLPMTRESTLRATSSTDDCSSHDF